MKRRLTLLFLTCVLSGCGVPASPSSPSETRPPTVPGLLRQAITELHASPQLQDWSCDLSLRSIREELASALDARSDLFLTAVTSEASAAPGFELRDVGPFSMQVRTREKRREADRWEIWPSSWSGIYADYQWLKEHSPDDSAQWASILRRVQFILSNDQLRVLDGVNFGLDHLALPHLEEFKQVVDACVGQTSCTQLTLAPELEAWARSVAFYRYYLNLLNRTDSPTARRDLLTTLQGNVARDAQVFAFRVEPAVVQTEPGVWTLTLDGTGIGAATRQLFNELMVAGWSDESRRVQLAWNDETPESVFRFIFSSMPGGRPHVSSRNREVRLFPLFDSDTFQHEMGHVLGFKDRYFTVWHNSSCSYREEYNPADLMSGSDTGLALESHWQELEARYPLVGYEAW